MKKYLLTLFLGIASLVSAVGAVADSLGRHLDLGVDALLFLRDNEFSTPMMKGYTLPGFRLLPKAGYSPSSRVRLEAGLYMLRFWGTDEYPNMAYRDIAKWDGTGRSTKGFHLLPYLRATMSPVDSLDITLGSIRGGLYHRLPEPLYAPELALTADPEAGIQVEWRNRRARVDAWVNWESFIYRGDWHQEAFVVGLSGHFDYTRPGAPVRVYSPLSLLIQHRGGEIDTIYTNSMQTLMNGAIGLGASISPGHRRGLGRLGLEAQYMVYRQVAGEIWPYRSGHAWWIKADAALGPVDLRMSWFRCRSFISLMGYPIYGSVGADKLFPVNTVWTVGAQYSWNLSPCYGLKAYADLYLQPGLKGKSYSVGLTMILRPSFPIKI